MNNNYLNKNGLFPMQRLKKFDLRDENIHIIRSLTQNSYLGDYISVCRILGNFILFVSTHDERHGIQLQLNGYWEMAVTEQLSKMIKPNMVVMDIGANYGYFTFLMSFFVGNGGTVYSIEPNKTIYELLYKSIKINGKKKIIKPLNIAISDSNSKKQLFVSSHSIPMNASLSENKTKKSLKQKFTKKSKVNVFSLDDLDIEHKNLDVIKVDIEGSENKFWFGSKKTRDRNPKMKIIMEFNKFRYDDADFFIETIFNENYKVSAILPNETIKLSKFDLLSLRTDQHTMLVLEKN